jgi:hypothetical protein
MIDRVFKAAAVVALLLSSGVAGAVPLSFAGAYNRDDDVALFWFETSGASLVSIETFGYAGGTDPSGRVVAAGGFDPVFGLYDAAGSLLGIGDDGASRADPISGNAFDSLLSMSLGIGTYFVALAVFDNYPLGPSFADGFLRTGNGNFTAPFGCSAGRFCDVSGFSRTGGYALAISGATVAAIPEPSALALMSAALAGFTGWRRLRGRRHPASGV